ncbi:MAG: PepSY-associated TM helix domain-containing protein [Verrucomicrobiales bacterium]
MKSRKRKRKAFWTKQFYLWHWVSSALCLAAMLLFAFTGITLNHAQDIPVEPVVNEQVVELPEAMMKGLAYAEGEEERKEKLPASVADWIVQKTGAEVAAKEGEWSEYEIYVSLPRPGGDAWLLIDRETGEVTYELTTRGAISFLNDLHKGRNTGPVWSWFLDIFSVACVIFCLTGLALLYVHAKRRPSTWPVVLAGIFLPVVLVIFFLH